MEYKLREIILRNGQICLLKSPTENDARDILEHLKQTSAETDYMARYEDEITMTIEQESIYLSKLLTNPKECMISAVIDGQLAANAGFRCVAPYDKYRHRAAFGISVKKLYWGMGVGFIVLDAMIEAAKAAGYEQLELDVVADNKRAVALYEKVGFKIYATRNKCFKYRDGSYGAEHLMMLEL